MLREFNCSLPFQQPLVPCHFWQLVGQDLVSRLIWIKLH